MYLHLGKSTVVTDQEILGIFDLDNASWACKTREFLERAEGDGRCVWLSDDFPRSIVLVGGRREAPTVYLSPFSPAVLSRRMEDGGRKLFLELQYPADL